MASRAGLLVPEGYIMRVLGDCDIILECKALTKISPTLYLL